MRQLLLLTALLLPGAALAQPAKDLYDAQQAAKQHERDLVPALQLSRETAGVLRLFLQVESTLGNTQLPAGSALDRALFQMDEYVREMEKRKAILPSDIRRQLGTARSMLDRARLPMPSAAQLAMLLDRWHHEVVHPTARRVSQEAAQINNLVQTYTMIENNLRQLQSTQLLVIAAADNVPGLPQGTPQP